MQRAMTWSMTTWAKLIVAMTLVFAAFFFAPAVDAATCLPEPPAAHAVVDHDQSEGDHSGKSGGHGICSHGHCHHTSTARGPAVDASLLCKAADRMTSGRPSRLTA